MGRRVISSGAVHRSVGAPDAVLAKVIGLQRTADEVMAAAVDVSGRILDTDATFAALPQPADGYRIRFSRGIRSPERFHEVSVRRSLGLGGQVLVEDRAMQVADYVHDRRITHHYADVVGQEGLRGIACVPIGDPGRQAGLLYAGVRAGGGIGDRAVHALEWVAGCAELALHEIAARRLELQRARARERRRLAEELNRLIGPTLSAVRGCASASNGAAGSGELAAALDQTAALTGDARRVLRGALGRLSEAPRHASFDARLEGEMRLVERRRHHVVQVIRIGDPVALPEMFEQLMIDVALAALDREEAEGGACFGSVRIRYERAAVSLEACCERAAGGPAVPDLAVEITELDARAARLDGNLDMDDGCALRLRLPLANSSDELR